MLLPLRTIWDTKIQSVCGVITAAEHGRVEIFFTANCGQATLSPARVVINPNRLYPIEGVLRRQRRFSISVLRSAQRDLALGVMNIRRRAIEKAAVLGLRLDWDDRFDIPYLPGCLRTVFCEVDQILETGDHTLMIARVLESRVDPAHAGDRPLLYPQLSGAPARQSGVEAVARTLLAFSGAKDVALKILHKLRPPSIPDIGANTYRLGGHTDTELAQVLAYGSQDESRLLRPPIRPPAALHRALAICVVGVGAWGIQHCRFFRQASPLVELYVCGRNPARLQRVAQAVGAKDYLIGLERAMEDRRFSALALVLPHDLHASAAQLAAAAGKHVLVEKPIATTRADADAMIAAARRAGTVLMVAEDVHFRSPVREAFLAVERGDIGEPLYLLVRAGGVLRPEGWKADRQRAGGGVLMDLGVHYVRAMRLLLGDPDRVFACRAMQVNDKMSGEDSVQLVFSSRFGWQAHMLLSWVSPRGNLPDMVIAGEKGTLHLWSDAPFYDLYPGYPLTLTRLLSYVRPAWLGEKLARPGLQRVRRKIEREVGYLGEVREFLAAVAEGREPISAPEDARRDLDIVLCAYAALRNQCWTDIPVASGRGTPANYFPVQK